MSLDRIDYPQFLQEALRDVVRRVLLLVADEGLPDVGYFYITFRTSHPGVEMPGHLRERFPEEMTIVLQHQFWDLEVEEDSFAVALQFNNVPQRLSVPFAALTAFVDPPAEFALRFEAGAEEAGDEEEEPAARGPQPVAPLREPDSGPGGSVIRFDPSRRK
jgi:uncharacterized protein